MFTKNMFTRIFSQFRKSTDINKVIMFLIYSDFFVQMGWGLINPIIAVFITDQIAGGDITVAGIATSIVMITQVIVQLPVSRWIDSRKGELDDFSLMVVGNLMIAVTAGLYLFINTPIQLYFLQIFNGIGMGLSYPGYLAIFTRHIDRNKEGYEWTIYSTYVNLGAAFSATLGGILAEKYGFNAMFLVAFGFSILGVILSVGIHSKLSKK